MMQDLKGKIVNRTALIEGILFIVIGAVGMGEGYRLSSIKDPNALYETLRPGMYIFILSFTLMITGVVHFIVNYRKALDLENTTASKKSKIRMVSIVLVLSAYAYLINVVGYLAASIPFFLLEFRILGIRSWRTSIILSLSFATGFYIVFVHFCNVIFPRGVLFR